MREQPCRTIGHVLQANALQRGGDAITLAGASDFTSSGLVNSDGIGSVTLTTSGAVGTAGVAGSPYSVVPSAAVGAASQVLTDYYDITYVDGAITVARKSLTVEADDVTLQVGASVPTSYSASYTGWVRTGRLARSE